MTVVPYHPEAPREWVALMAPAVELAKAVANTDFVPAGLRANPAAITAAILYGDEVGLGPMQALANIAVIDGRPSLAAEAMAALVLQRGHELWVEDASNTRVTVAGRRKDSDQVSRVTWTKDDAKAAGLDGKTNWRRYPRAMLTRRATAELCRAVFADAIGGLAATEELEDQPDGEPSDLVAAGGQRRRRRAPLAPVSAPAEAEPKASAPVPPLPGEEDSAAVSGPTPESAGSGLGDDAPEPAAAETLADNEPLRKRLMATYREKGFTEQDARHAFARFVIGHEIASSNDLTAEEAGHIIDVLEHGHTLAEPAGEDAILAEALSLGAVELPPEPS